MRKPKSLQVWEAHVEKVKAQIPRCCYTCASAQPDPRGGTVFCRRYEQLVPQEYADVESEQCSDWLSVLDEVPF